MAQELAGWAEADELALRARADGRGGITTRISALHVRGYVALGRGDLLAARTHLDEARALGEPLVHNADPRSARLLILEPERSSMTWGDADRQTLYLCARDRLYRIRLNVAGAIDLTEKVRGSPRLVKQGHPLAEIGQAFRTAADKTSGSIKVTIAP